MQSLQDHKLVRQLTADKKKLGMMIGLLAVGLLLWGRLLMKEVPRTATAKPPVAGAVAAPEPEAEVESGPVETVALTLPDTLGRDPFAFDPSVYRRLEKNTSQAYQPKKDPQTPDIEFRLAKAREAASRLKLEAVLQGDDPGVVIDGQWLRIGQQINEFTVVRIEERKVVLEMNGVYVRLGM